MDTLSLFIFIFQHGVREKFIIHTFLSGHHLYMNFCGYVMWDTSHLLFVRFVGPPVHGLSSCLCVSLVPLRLLGNWATGTLGHRNIGTLEHLDTGKPGHWDNGWGWGAHLLQPWCEFWKIETPWVFKSPIPLIVGCSMHSMVYDIKWWCPEIAIDV